MKKIISGFLILVIILYININSLRAQQGSSIIFDLTPYGIRSFHTFSINGSPYKLIYLQQGMIDTGQGNEGGFVHVLQNDRINWTSVPYLNARCCVSGNKCFPIDYITVSRTVPSIFIINGLFECISPPGSGDYSRISYTNGTTFAELPFSGTDSVQQCRGFDISKTNPNIMYMAHNFFNGTFHAEPRVFKSTNGGHNWFVTDTLAGMKPISHHIVNEAGFLKALTWNHDVVFTSTDEHLAYSIEGGYNFQVRTDVPPFKMIVFDEGDHWIHGVAYNNSIYCNNGNIINSWVPLSNPFNIICIEIDPDDHTKWYAGSDNNGVWKSTNAGLTFFPYNNTFTPSRKVIGISKDSGSGDTLIVATDKKVYKVWESVIVNINEEETTPAVFKLHQNFPNPFNPVTRISYDLRIADYVSVKVYDVLGNEVASLVNEKKNKGSYSVDFNASGLSSGIYFYILKTNDLAETRKMMLLK